MRENYDAGTVDQIHYDQPQERIFNDARGSENLIVLAVKAGKPVMWTNGDDTRAQELVSQFFPDATLPEPARQAESAIG